MDELKNELIQICNAFNLGVFQSSYTKEKRKGFLITEFTTTKGTFQHYYKIKD